MLRPGEQDGESEGRSASLYDLHSSLAQLMRSAVKGTSKQEFVEYNDEPFDLARLIDLRLRNYSAHPV